jgi:DNA-directed RNA polymerase subunit K/omega
MIVFTPGSVARHTGSKYLGVLVAAKYARMLNEFRRNEILAQGDEFQESPREKLTTLGLDHVASGAVEFKLVDRRPVEF